LGLTDPAPPGAAPGWLGGGRKQSLPKRPRAGVAALDRDLHRLAGDRFRDRWSNARLPSVVRNSACVLKRTTISSGGTAGTSEASATGAVAVSAADCSEATCFAGVVAALAAGAAAANGSGSPNKVDSGTLTRPITVQFWKSLPMPPYSPPSASLTPLSSRAVMPAVTRPAPPRIKVLGISTVFALLLLK
jgi:hypothetical protein